MVFFFFFSCESFESISNLEDYRNCMARVALQFENRQHIEALDGVCQMISKSSDSPRLNAQLRLHFATMIKMLQNNTDNKQTIPIIESKISTFFNNSSQNNKNSMDSWWQTIVGDMTRRDVDALGAMDAAVLGQLRGATVTVEQSAVAWYNYASVCYDHACRVAARVRRADWCLPLTDDTERERLASFASRVWQSCDESQRTMLQTESRLHSCLRQILISCRLEHETTSSGTRGAEPLSFDDSPLDTTQPLKPANSSKHHVIKALNVLMSNHLENKVSFLVVKRKKNQKNLLLLFFLFQKKSFLPNLLIGGKKED